VFSVFGTAVGLLSLGSHIFDYLVNLPLYWYLIVIAVSIAIGYAVIVPFLYAFWFKRHLFLQTDNWYYLNDVYSGNDLQLYNNSIYKIEDDLFEALGARHEKLNEIPFDKIFTISTGSWVISFFVYLSLSTIFDTMAVSEQLQQNLFTGIIVGLFGLLGTIYAIILPVLTYRHRRSSRLL
jgi:hypothetical protein